MRTLHTSIRGGDAHADIADGRRFTARRRPQVGLLSTVTRCFNSDPLRYNVAFVAEKKPWSVVATQAPSAAPTTHFLLPNDV